MDRMSFVIEGAPVTKKNHQQIAVNRTTGSTFLVQSAANKAWSAKAAEQLRRQWGGRAPIEGPLCMTAMVYRERATGDLLNYLAAISDVLEAPTPLQLRKLLVKRRPKMLPKAGVIVNDRQIVALDGSRMLKDARRPRVELSLVLLDDPEFYALG